MSVPSPEEVLELNEALHDVIDSAPKTRLARSARLLGMYLALYKRHYGELTPAQYEEINGHVERQDEVGRAIYSDGMQELIEMLAVVAAHEPDPVRHVANPGAVH